MKVSKIIILSMMICLMMYSVQAALQVVGSHQGWNNNDSAWDIYDDGTHGDSNPNDGIYTLATTVATAGSYEWKIVSTNNWGFTYPSGSNTWFETTTASQAVTFYLDFNVDTTWSPASVIFYTTAQPATTYTAVGMQTWLGHSQDWDNAYSGALMHDDGLNGDAVASDGIYSLRITFPSIDPSTTSAKDFKVTLDGAWSHQIGSGQEDGSNWGFNVNGNQKGLSAFNSNDTILLLADSIKGRLRIQQTYPPLAGPPWYAVGDVQGEIRNTSTIMYDDGTNGDVTGSDGIYSRTFNSTFSLVTHWTNAVDQQGNRHPVSSNSKGLFYSSSSGDNVRVLYDTNTALDGWLPYTNFTYTEAAYIGTHTYTAVGDFQSEVGGTDWLPSSGLTLMNDTGGNGDLIPGDNIYTFQGIITDATVTTLTNFYYKVALDSDWLMQIGGDGKSINGSPGTYEFQAINGDTIRFEADVVKGRINASNLTNATHPSPSINGTNGNLGQDKVATASGGSTPYIHWTSNNPSVIAVSGFSGNTATLSYIAFGSSTITVYDQYGMTASTVLSTVPTSAPLVTESSDMIILHESMPIYMKD